jgi:hypothetical protein
MPRVAIEPLAVTRTGTGRWKVRWRVTNESEPLRLTAIGAPHGKFRSRDHAIDVPLAAGARFEPQLEIACSEPPGSEIENTFLIITAEAAATTWRILARMRVRVGADGVPHPVTERVDMQEVGSS